MTFEVNGKTYKKVNKPAARKAYENQQPILIYPSKMRPGGVWNIGVIVTAFEKPFDSLVNEFEFYNCNSETGMHAGFGVEV